MPQKTKDELVAELEALKEQVEVLEYQAHHRKMVESKTAFLQWATVGFFAICTAVQSIFAALKRPSPFTGAFAWMLFGYTVLFLFVYLGQIAMHMNKKVKLQAELSEQKAKIGAAIDASK